MPYVTFVSLFMICAGLTNVTFALLVCFTSFLRCAPDHDSDIFTDYSLFYYFLLWFCFASLSLTFIFIHGIEYVSWPRLIPPTDVIYYNGPGFRSGHNGKGINKSNFDAEQLNSKASAKWLSTGRKRTTSRIEEIELGTKKKSRLMLQIWRMWF